MFHYQFIQTSDAIELQGAALTSYAATITNIATSSFFGELTRVETG